MAPTRQVVGWATGRVCHENDSPLTLGGARAHDIWRYATSLGITHWHEVEWRLFPPGYIDPLSPCDGSPAQLRGWHWHRVAYRCRGHSRHTGRFGDQYLLQQVDTISISVARVSLNKLRG